MQNLRDLGDQELHEKIVARVREERQITTEVLRLLREVEHRRLFVDHHCSSLFEYAVKCLKYDESAANRRISAMKLLKELPELEQKVECGSLSLSVVVGAQKLFRKEKKIGKPLSVSEKREVMKALEGKSARKADRVLLARATEPLSLRPERVTAVSETHSELRFLVKEETLQKLERIRGLLGHSHSEMTWGELVEAMAKIALEKLDPAREPKRVGSVSRAERQPAQRARLSEDQVSKSVATSQPNESLRRYISAALRRKVWQRARGRCVLCRGIYRLQIDHVQPIALGGSNDIENLRLLCFHCNQRQADLKLGREKMKIFRGGSAAPS